MIDIKGLDKAELLKALYDGTTARGVGLLFAVRHLPIDHARSLVEEGLSFDYVFGKPLKVNLSGDELDPRLYDRDAGDGRAAQVITALRGRK